MSWVGCGVCTGVVILSSMVVALFVVVVVATVFAKVL